MAYINGKEVLFSASFGAGSAAIDIELSKENGVTTLSITDANGTQTVEIKDGADGKTPEKGTDYFTEEDKAEIVADVKSSAETWSFTLEDGSTITKKVVLG